MTRKNHANGLHVRCRPILNQSTNLQPTVFLLRRLYQSLTLNAQRTLTIFLHVCEVYSSMPEVIFGNAIAPTQTASI